MPVDLEHIEKLPKAPRTAVDLAGHLGATVHDVGAMTETPTPIAHNPAEYQRKLEAFAKEQATRTGSPPQPR